MANVTDISTRQVWDLLEAVTDPEVPVLSILDLGIVRDVKAENDDSGCSDHSHLFRLPGHGCDQHEHPDATALSRLQTSEYITGFVTRLDNRLDV